MCNSQAIMDMQERIEELENLIETLRYEGKEGYQLLTKAWADNEKLYKALLQVRQKRPFDAELDKILDPFLGENDED